MPITSIDVRDGDPTIQVSGQHRGTVTATFADGRIVERNLRAPDADAWNDLIAAISAEIQAKQEIQDAETAVDADTEVASSQEATQQQVAVAYLRTAWESELAYDGYRLIDRFNNYRLAKGWSMAQVVANLTAAGLTQEEWDNISAAYSYLSGAGRPAIMADALTIQANWEAQH